jgi:hypothetical protein
MALPKIDQPIFKINLLSRNEALSFRPFTVKEHKILLMATESNDVNDILSAIKQIINNCCLDDIDVDDLPVIDLEMFFINLRARSIGEVVEMKYKCKNKIGEEECGKHFQMGLNLLQDVQINKNDVDNRIALTETIGMVLMYPTTNVLQKIMRKADEEQELDVSLIANCIEYIYDEDELYYAKDATEEELIKFVNDLNTEQYSRAEDFLKSAPSIYANKQHICKKCGFEHSMRLEGIADFFM